MKVGVNPMQHNKSMASQLCEREEALEGAANTCSLQYSALAAYSLSIIFLQAGSASCTIWFIVICFAHIFQPVKMIG